MKLDRFATYAWTVLGYNLAVILWGAYVRASGAGAGCGSHWPLCNGEVIPRSPRTATIIEFTHRLTSGASLLLILGLALWAFRAYRRGHPVRRGATLAAVLILTEALVGAGLVLFELVAHDASLARALFISVHLTNTFLLLASLALTAWWASGGAPLELKGQGGFTILFGTALLATLILGISGAVTALGDTLFPASTLMEGVRQDLSSTAHLFVRLRIFHPAIAAAVGCYLIFLAASALYARPGGGVKSLALILISSLAAQLAIGALNLMLLAPVGLQLVHLLLADFVWLALVLLAASVLGQTATSVAAAEIDFDAALRAR